MAIIIVAITAFLVVSGIFWHIKLRINYERKVLRSFYDILFLAKFFNELKRRNLIKKFLRDGEKIHVTRKLVKNEEKVDFLKGKSRKNYNLSYVFKIKDNIFEIYGFVNCEHKKLKSVLSNTKFELAVKKNRIEISFNNLFNEFICVFSAKTIVQSLLILLESEIREFKEEQFLFCSEEEIEVTEKVIEEIQNFLLNVLNA